ncbi:hypothetical protein OTU49_008618 [Cherax quadricarinatus]|uniref:Chemosensory protein n=1 Tax=Cherax quadricarinatus TaxID=27406 RepID=A0AAW0WT41_CHEQU
MKNLVYSAVALAAIIVVAEAQTAFLATLNNAQISYLSSEEGLNAMITCYQTRNDPACSDLVLRTLAEFPELVRSNCNRCNSDQRRTYQNILSQVSSEYPAQFNTLRRLFLS